MVELGTTVGLSTPVILSVVGAAWLVGRVEGRLSGVERSVGRLEVTIDRLCADIDGLREDGKAVLLRLPANVE